MNTKLTLLLLAVMAACFVALQSNSPEPVTPSGTVVARKPVTFEEHPVSQPVAAEETVVEAPETEVVMGITVRKDRNCTVRRHYVDLGNGTVTDAYSCVPNEASPDEYEQYGNEELRVLAYNDAKAASVLGKRLVDVDLEQSRELLLRAVALQPANLDPVMWLAAHAYSVRGDSTAARDARANTYVLTRTAQAMGSAASTDWIIADLEQAGFAAGDIAKLDNQVKSTLRRIRNIQLEVFGESVVDEVLL